MTIVYGVLLAAGLVPLAGAWWANRTSSLSHAVVWMGLAWLIWGAALLGADANVAGLEPVRFLALCLTGAVGIAVLGARRPYVLAWNFVVVGLVAVMLLPLLESLFIGTHPVDPLRVFFLCSTLAVGLLNYLPSCFAPTVVMLAPAMAGEVMALFAPNGLPERGVELVHLLVLLTPWAAWGCWRGRRPAHSQFDRLWLNFRDRYGLLWAQRVRDQFNRAAANADWPVYLAWRGLHRRGSRDAIAPAAQEAMFTALCKALQRFTEK
jgi:hypothetical protein